MSRFPEYPERSSNTIAVVGIGLAQKKRSALLKEVVSPVSESVKAGPLDIKVGIDKSRPRELPEGEIVERNIQTEIGGYAISVDITVTRLPT